MNILMISLLALLTAQIIKIFTVFPPQPQRIFGSGGMPSSHSAFVTCLTTQIAFIEGIDSHLFAISAVFSLITIYDSGAVRKAVGEQAKILNRLINTIELTSFEQEKDNIKKEFRELIGHTPFEIIAGIMLGFIIALLGV